MTNNKTTTNTDTRKEKIQQASKKTIGVAAPAVSKWWSFMKEKVGPIWSVIIIILGLLIILGGNFLAGFLYIFVIGPISILTVKYARPNVIVTRGSLLDAKLGWAVGFPVCALLLTFQLTLAYISDREDARNAQSNYELACSEEGIKKSGKIGCKKAKEKYSLRLQKELEPIQMEFTEEKKLVDQYTKEKNKKCTEKGIIEYGSDGCNEATNNLEQHTKLRDEYQQKVKSLKQKINDLKK